jgi:hypothetical protein
VVKVFQAREEPWEVSRVDSARPNGTVGPCIVTGWSSDGPVPAYAAKVFDSGEGTVLLVYGGDAGIRLKSPESVEPWSLDAADQWGEPCLLLASDTAVE